jgi:hypothetical protein
VHPSKQPAPINFIDRASDPLALAEITHCAVERWKFAKICETSSALHKNFSRPAAMLAIRICIVVSLALCFAAAPAGAQFWGNNWNNNWGNGWLSGWGLPHHRGLWTSWKSAKNFRDGGLGNLQ